jgi:hypothetical protein
LVTEVKQTKNITAEKISDRVVGYASTVKSSLLTVGKTAASAFAPTANVLVA